MELVSITLYSLSVCVFTRYESLSGGGGRLARRRLSLVTDSLSSSITSRRSSDAGQLSCLSVSRCSTSSPVSTRMGDRGRGYTVPGLLGSLVVRRLNSRLDSREFDFWPPRLVPYFLDYKPGLNYKPGLEVGVVVMAALCNGGAIIFLPCSFFLSSSSFFSSPNLIGHRLDVYHTSTHGVALVRI